MLRSYAAMLVRDDGDSALCIGQASHAWISGQLARAWGGAFARPEPYEPVCLGAEQHDVGMAEWDLAPALDPETGWPRTFMNIAPEEHASLWRAAPDRLRTQSRYAALLTSMHATALYDGRDPSPIARGMLDHMARVQAELLDALGEDPARARRNQRLLWVWDWLSLATLLRWAPDSERVAGAPGDPDVELRLEPLPGEGIYSLDPWPFAVPDRLVVQAEGRRLTARCETGRELHAALAAAPWETVLVELLPRG